MAPGVKLVLDMAEDLIAEQLERHTSRISRFVVSSGGGLTAAITAPLALLSAPVVAATMAHNDATRLIRRSTGATGAKLDDLVNVMDQVRVQTRASIDDAGAVVSQLAQALGLAGADLAKVSTAVISLAKVGGSDLQSAATVAIRAMAAWGVSGAAAADALGMLQRAARTSAGGSAGLLEQLAQAGPALKASGMTLEQSGAMLVGLATAGVSTEAALAGLTKAMTKLSKESAEPAAALRQQIESIRSCGDVTQAGQQAVELFGRIGLVMADAIRHGMFATDALQAIQIPTSDGVTSAGKALTELWIRTEQALEPLGKAIQSTLWPMATLLVDQSLKIVDIVITMARAFVSLPEWVQTMIVVVGGLSASVGPALAYFAMVLRAVAGMISAAIKRVPIGLIFSVIAGAVLAAYMIPPEVERMAQASPVAAVAQLPATITESGAVLGQAAQSGVEVVDAVDASTTGFGGMAGTVTAARSDVLRGTALSLAHDGTPMTSPKFDGTLRTFNATLPLALVISAEASGQTDARPMAPVDWKAPTPMFSGAISMGAYYQIFPGAQPAEAVADYEAFSGFVSMAVHYNMYPEEHPLEAAAQFGSFASRESMIHYWQLYGDNMPAFAPPPEDPSARFREAFSGFVSMAAHYNMYPEEHPLEAAAQFGSFASRESMELARAFEGSNDHASDGDTFTIGSPSLSPQIVTGGQVVDAVMAAMEA